MMITFVQYRLADGEIAPRCKSNCIGLSSNALKSNKKWSCLQITDHPPLFEFSSNYTILISQINQLNFKCTNKWLQKMAYEKFVQDFQDFLERQIFSVWHSCPFVTVIFEPLNVSPADSPPSKGMVHFINMTLVMGNQPVAKSNCCEKWLPKFWDSDFVQERRNFYMVERIMQL